MHRNLHRHTLVALCTALVALAGCDALKGPELDLSADRTTISAGGFEYAEITAIVKTKGKPAVGVEVEFETEFGSFNAIEDVSTQSVATDADGLAVIRLYSSLEQGQTQVTATYADEETGQDAVDRITIVFGPPQAGNLPVSDQFHLECAYLNVGAFRVPKPDIEVPCNLSAQTALGDNLSVESLNISFLSEAGTLSTVVGEENYNVVYSVQGGNPLPEDVPPFNSEPVRTGNLGEEYNPRDGVVTLVAITRGSEAFIDVNGNGVRDSGEQYTDSREPFLDTNDNGEYDLGEPYHDTNGDGEWTGKNGQFDGDTAIWTWTKVLWTGALEEAPDAGRLETNPASTVLQDGGQMTMSIWLLDRHMNPVASFSDGYDYLDLSDSSGNLAFNPDYTVSLSEQFPLSFDADGAALEFYLNNGCSMVAGCYQITVLDGSPGYVEDPPLPYILSVNLYTTPGPQLTDWLEQQQSWFVQNISGTTE